MWISFLGKRMEIVFILEMLVAVSLFTWKFPRRDHFKERAVGCTAFLLITSVISNHFSELFSYEWMSYYIIAEFCVLFLLVSLGIWFCFHATLYDVLFCGVGAWAVQNALYQGTNIIEKVVELFGVHLMRHPFISVLLLLLCHVITYFLVYRWTFPRLRQHYTVGKGNLLALSCAVLVIVLRVLPVAEGTSLSHQIAWIFLHILVDLLALYIMFGMSENSVMKLELETLQKMWRLKEEHYEQFKQIAESINLKCHDLRYQISLFRQGVSTASEQETLRELERAVMIYDSIAKTGNEALDTILTEKSLFCEKNGILLTYMVDGERLDFVKPSDLYVIFGNALDNAIEGVMKLPKSEDRVIALTVTGNDGFVAIQLQNTYDGELTISDGLPITSKADAVGHGYGVRSIQLLSRKYGGDMTFSTENGMFTLNILLSVA